MLILGIETSCDETAASIVEDGRKVISNVVLSQIEKHKEWGGVIPEVASRLHLESINSIINQTILEASKLEENPSSNNDKELLNNYWQKIDAIAVTNKPGLIGSLLVGVNVAKTLAWIHDKPLIPVNHLYGHVCANFIDSEIEPPFICLLASGGHTQIIKVQSYHDMQILGETIDDAAGEAFDKVARLMDLPYPGGPHLDKLAKNATEFDKYSFPISKVDGFDFSFSGLKTAVLRLKQKLDDSEWEENKANIAYAFQDTVAKTFYKKISKATEETGIESVVLAGGVAANSRIRGLFQEKFPAENLCFPPLKYCTDNAAMIASAGYFMRDVEAKYDDFSFEVFSRA